MMLAKLKGWLAAAGVAMAAILAAWLSGRKSGATAERTANRAKEADAYETELNRVTDAINARNAVRPVDYDSLPDDDPYRRD